MRALFKGAEYLFWAQKIAHNLGAIHLVRAHLTTNFWVLVKKLLKE